MEYNWSMYGVQKARSDYKAGVEDIREARVYECGHCGYAYDRKSYATLSEFFTGHYAKCGPLPQNPDLGDFINGKT